MKPILKLVLAIAYVLGWIVGRWRSIMARRYMRKWYGKLGAKP